jgi:hypothetical protein
MTAGNENSDNVISTDTNYACIVDVVMRVGGSQSALFRYPKFREKVLVGVEGDSKYLLGYLPSDQDNIHTGENHKDILPVEKAGQFFRYKGPNDDAGEEKNYSEIGFYNETATLEKDKKDALKITSTGDIKQKSGNHNQIKTKRFELLVNCEGSKETDGESKRKYPFGDQEGDDVELYEGDVHIRAKKRIIIKAGKEIRLEVGRSSITINDKAIKIASRKTRSNIENGWDSKITVDAMKGVNAFGQRLTFRAGVEFELSEAYGGKIGSTVGVTRIMGMDVRLSTLGTKNYFIKGMANGLNWITNCVTMALGASGMGSSMGFAGSTASSLGLRVLAKAGAEKMVGSNLEIYDLKGAENNMIFALLLIFIAYNVTSLALETCLGDKFDDEDNKFRDIWMSVWALLEYGAALTAFGFICTGHAKGFIHESALHLSGKSEMTLDAINLKFFGMQTVDAKSEMAGESEKKAEENKAKEAKKKAEKELKAAAKNASAQTPPAAPAVNAPATPSGSK